MQGNKSYNTKRRGSWAKTMRACKAADKQARKQAKRREKVERKHERALERKNTEQSCRKIFNAGIYGEDFVLSLRAYNTCSSKRYHATPESARKAMAERQAYTDETLSFYHCPFCGGYHLTSNPLDDETCRQRKERVDGILMENHITEKDLREKVWTKPFLDTGTMDVALEEAARIDLRMRPYANHHARVSMC